MVIEKNLRPGWIYNLDDYKKVFALSDADLQKTIVDFPGYFSSVNAEVTALGGKIISVDPLYHLSPQEMEAKVRESLKNGQRDLQKNSNILVSNHDNSIDQITDKWRENAEKFLLDYSIGKQQGRYLTYEELPKEKLNDLLLAADFLFKNAENNIEKIMEQLCRLAVEVRIFPLSEVEQISSQLGPLMLVFQNRNFGVEVRAISYPLRADGQAMLRIWAKECKVSL